MPIHLTPITRRRFLRNTATFALATSPPLTGRSAPPIDPNLFAWLNDTHVSENTQRAPNGQNIAANLRHIVAWLLARPRWPAGVIINGDCAHNAGLPGDYEVLRALLQPLVAAGIPVHLTMGNHDDRDVFFQCFKQHGGPRRHVLTKHVGVVRSPHACFFLLDTLKVTNQVEGNLGREQMTWLEGMLRHHADRPAIVVAHHDPQWKENPPESKFRWSGLEETPELFELLARLPHVKAYVHGHVHQWGLSAHRGIHVINTPAAGYVGNPKTSSTGWVMARLEPAGVQLTRHCIDPKDPRHNGRFALNWRAG